MRRNLQPLHASSDANGNTRYVGTETLVCVSLCITREPLFLTKRNIFAFHFNEFLFWNFNILSDNGSIRHFLFHIFSTHSDLNSGRVNPL